MIEVKIGIVSISIGVIFLLAWNMARNRVGSGTTTLSDSLKKAGVPDQIEEKDLANLENSKMVSEGSQFGVQYFNEFMHS